MSDIDSLIRERLNVAAAFDVETDPASVRENIARRQRRIRRRRPTTILVGVLAVVGIAAGALLVVDRDSGGDVAVRPDDTPERASDDAEASAGSGPRFVGAPGWETSQGPTTATAATVSLGPDVIAGDPIPWETVERLEEGDVLLQAQFSAGEQSTAFGAHFPSRELPLSLDDAHPATAYKGQPNQVTAHVDGWNIDVFVFFGGGDPTAVPPVPPEPTAQTRAAAQDQLSRLVVPARETPEPTAAADGPAVISGTQPQYLLPGWLPEGVEPVQALRFGDIPQFGGEVVAYGRRDADDPWDGPILASFHIVPGPDSFWGEGGTDGPTIGGHLSRLKHDEQGWWMEWSTEGGLMLILGIDVSREQVVAAAEAVSAEPAIDPAGLPDGLTELARGPVHAAVPWGGYTGSSTGLWVSYGNGAVGTDESRLMHISERRQESAAVVDLFRLAYPDTRAVDIRGQHAVVGRNTDGNVALQWYESSGGLLVTLTAWGLTEDTLRRVAEDLRAAGSDEIEQLLTDHPACPQNGLWTHC